MIFFNVLRLQTAITPPLAIIIDRRKFVTNWSLHGMSSFVFFTVVF